MWDNNATSIPGRARAWRLAAGWAAVIFVLSSIPGSAFPEVPGRFSDKIVHIALYGTLGVLIGRALAATTSLGAPARVALTCALATVYGITDELHQLFTPRRSCDWHDVVADAIGGLLGGLLAATFLSRPQTTTPKDATNVADSKDSLNQP